MAHEGLSLEQEVTATAAEGDLQAECARRSLGEEDVMK